MVRKILVCLVAVAGALLAGAPAMPDTPAGKRCAEFLKAFNGGDQAALKTFHEMALVAREGGPSVQERVQRDLQFREQSGGLDVQKVEESTNDKIVVLVKMRESEQYGRLQMMVEPQAPFRVMRMGIGGAPNPEDTAPATPLTQEQMLAATRAKLDELAAKDQFSGAVLIAKDGEAILQEARGFADRSKKTPNTLDTQFRIGSMNKMFTATATLQLAQAGKLKLTDPIGKYLTDYPNKELAAKVTVHHLLTHTGGTGDIFGPEFAAHRLELRDLKDYVALYGKRDVKFVPGDHFEYSNYGFLLLGVLIEKVSGQSYYEYVREHIFKPAGMTGTDSLPEGENVPKRSAGYMRKGKEWTPNTDTLPYRGTSAGGGYSTVGDLLRFTHALVTGKLLDREHFQLMTTGKVKAGPGQYAYGFQDLTENGVRRVGHGGGAPGMNGDLRIFTESGYLVAVLSNLDPPAAERVAGFISNRLPAQ